MRIVLLRFVHDSAQKYNKRQLAYFLRYGSRGPYEHGWSHEELSSLYFNQLEYRDEGFFLFAKSEKRTEATSANRQ